ncbi:translation elongation factor Ts [Neobittarella massiliensis]|uniref:Elongation factor Ts n=1 Tax=Neobittarella massiliensis (ex Bilen et al. 2018) TaxID=2041842 RepID=A0A8J6LYJ0_9FIRM|nr:translation elongation factor Ts [Neobittarella massiliensis]MBC3515627.1 elongation factor Ts [Neobittarella massiliensis]
MAFTAKDVKELREKTGCGMMDCKKALTEAEGDMDKAIELLREKGLAAAAKKSGRIAADGLVYAYVDDVNKVGVVIEVNSETDFVAKNAEFQAFVDTCAKTVAQKNPADVAALMAEKAVDSDMTVEEMLREKILTIGENLIIRRFARFEGDVVTYIHGGGTHGVMVLFDTDLAGKPEFAAYGKDVAMQIAAANPTFVRKEEVPAEQVEKEKEILKVQALNEGKPANIAEKMVMGRINKFFKEVCLLEQPFVKDQDLTVAKYTQNTAKELGGKIEIVKFVRFEKGEGIEKRQDDLAAEVAKMVK